MPIVLVDAPSISLDLVGAVEPKAVRVVVSGLTPGATVTVTGQAGAHQWAVRGGSAPVTTTQVALTDVATPLNTPITYTVTVDGVAFAAGPITVPYPGKYVLQALNGRSVVPFVWQNNGDPRDTRVRSVTFDVPARPTPLARWDISSGESGVIRAKTTSTATATLLELLATGAPVMVIRTDGSMRDLAPVQTVLLTRATRVLWRGAEDPAARLWDLAFEVIDDPEPDLVLPASTGDDFDAAWVGRTGDDFDAEMAGLSWDDFDVIDWTQYA